jgi:hypothetical protein
VLVRRVLAMVAAGAPGGVRCVAQSTEWGSSQVCPVCLEPCVGMHTAAPAAADAVEHLMRAGVMTGANGTARRTATGAVRRPTTVAGDSDASVRPLPKVRNLSSKPPATAVGRYQSYYSKVCTNERCGHGGDRDARMAATVQYRNVVDILEGKKLSAQHFAPRKLMAVLQNPGDDNHEPYNVARAHYYAIGPKTRSAWRLPLRSQTDKAGVAGWGRRNKSKRR